MLTLGIGSTGASCVLAAFSPHTRLAGVWLISYVLFLIIRNQEYLVPPGPDDGFHAREIALHNTYQTESGLTVNTPRGMYQCWQIPLPCSPLPPEGLAERVPGELKHGFKIAKIEADG